MCLISNKFMEILNNEEFLCIFSKDDSDLKYILKIYIEAPCLHIFCL